MICVVWWSFARNAALHTHKTIIAEKLARIIILDALARVLASPNCVLIHSGSADFSENCCVEIGTGLHSKLAPFSLQEGNEANSLFKARARRAGMLPDVVDEVKLKISPWRVELAVLKPPQLKTVVRRRVTELRRQIKVKLWDQDPVQGDGLGAIVNRCRVEGINKVVGLLGILPQSVHAWD